MENAVDAIKMAFGMMVFVIAMTAAMYLFTIASSTSQVLLYSADKTNYYDNIEISKDDSGKYRDVTIREVNVETIIPTLYRYYKENFAVKILDKNGNLTQIFDVNIEGKVRKAAGTFIDTTIGTPEEIANRTRELQEQEALISLYGIPKNMSYDALPDAQKKIKPYLFEAPWIGNTNKDFKTRVDLYVSGQCGYINGTKVDYTNNNLKNFEGCKFLEQFTEYVYKGDTISSEDGTESITGNSKIETKIVITYQAIDDTP